MGFRGKIIVRNKGEKIMNREIKFRGKVIDEPDEWVYGYLMSHNRIEQIEEHERIKCCGVGIFAVEPKTIGQYTGLKDRNGVEIYEGDILRKQNIYYGRPNGYSFKTIKWERQGFNINGDLKDYEVFGNIYTIEN